MNGSFDDGIKQPNFSIIAKNANAEDLERFIQVLEDTLASIVEQGMDKKSLLAAINYFEFKHKEGNFGRFPKGLMLGLNAFSTWLYDDAAALDLFSLNDVYDALKQDVETGYFEALIKQYILQNTHKSYCLLMPKKGLNNEIAEREKARLAAYKETLSAADIEEIRANMMHLKEYQSSGDAEEDLKKIPMLAIDDIEKHAKKINNRILEIEHVKVLSHDIFTNGITYLSLNFCMDDIDYDKFPVIALLTEIFKYVDTEHFSYSELSNEINLYTGGIGFSTTVTNKKEYGGYVTHFVVSAKMLDAQLDKAMELIMGTSQPATEVMVETFKGTPYDTGLDQNLLAEIADYFRPYRDECLANGLLNPKVMGVDIKTLLYQVPGGMLSNMVSQLKEQNAEDRYYDVLKEIPKVRKDLGEPPLVTPSSQIVGTQAVFNVLLGERYKMATKETKAVLRGEYGQTVKPMSQEVIDKVIPGEERITCRYADLLDNEMDKLEGEMKEWKQQDEDVLSYALFPQVATDFFKYRQAQQEKVDMTQADTKNGAYPV